MSRDALKLDLSSLEFRGQSFIIRYRIGGAELLRPFQARQFVCHSPRELSPFAFQFGRTAITWPFQFSMGVAKGHTRTCTQPMELVRVLPVRHSGPPSHRTRTDCTGWGDRDNITGCRATGLKFHPHFQAGPFFGGRPFRADPQLSCSVQVVQELVPHDALLTRFGIQNQVIRVVILVLHRGENSPHPAEAFAVVDV